MPHRIILIAAVLGACALGPLQAQASPQEVQGLELVQRLGVELPKDLPFVDQDGQAIAFGQVFDGLRPVILTFNYSTCPSLCSMQLNSFTAALQRLDLELGRDYRVVTVSLSHEDTVEVAKKQQRKYVDAILRPEAALSGWTFLTGPRSSIDALAGAAGWPFRWLPDIKEYAHRPIFVYCTPRGVISQYLEAIGNGITERDLKLSLLKAGEGTIGSIIDQIYLFCFHLDPTKGWTPNALNLMSAGGAITLLILGLFLFIWWRGDIARDRRTLAEERAAQASASEA